MISIRVRYPPFLAGEDEILTAPQMTTHGRPSLRLGRHDRIQKFLLSHAFAELPRVEIELFPPPLLPTIAAMPFEMSLSKVYHCRG